MPGERTIKEIVDEVGTAQVEDASIITLNVILTFDQLHALTRHVDQFIEERYHRPCMTDDERHELDAMQALQDAWPYRWKEPPR